MKTFSIFFDGITQRTMTIKASSIKDAQEWAEKQIEQWNKKNEFWDIKIHLME